LPSLYGKLSASVKTTDVPKFITWTPFYFDLLMFLFHTVFLVLSFTWLIAGSILAFITQNTLPPSA